MNKPIPLLCILLAFWITATSYWQYNLGCCTAAVANTTTSTISATAPVIVPPLEPASVKAIAIEDQSTTFSLGLSDNLTFGVSNHHFGEPISDSLNMVFTRLADYLKENPNRSIKLTGLYQAEEANESMLATLGLGRANQVKKKLVDLGAASSQIDLGGEVSEDISRFEAALTNAVAFEFFETPVVDASQLKVIEERLRSNPLKLYFDTDAKQLDLTDKQRQFFTDVVSYLSKNPKAILKTTGHTDDKGEYVRNKYISRKRAEFVRDYLVQNGISEKQIWVFYEGPDLPIADNETRAGRAKNRRVEITLR